MNKILPVIALVCCSLLLAACGGGIDLVDAGTYSGTVDKAVAEEREIYVSLDEGPKLELYFTDTTELLADGQPVEFSELSKGTAIEVTVAREGNRNIPTRVVIVE